MTRSSLYGRIGVYTYNSIGLYNMKVLAIISQKGGVGKTTLATSLAVAAEADGKSAVILDLDDQASACFWADKRQAGHDGPSRPTVRDVKPVRLPAALDALRDAGCDLVVIDCPPIARDIAADAAAQADFVLIPTRANAMDMASMTTTLQQLKAAERPCAVVFTFAPPSGPEVPAASAALSARGTLIAPAIGNRKAFERAPAAGQTVQETEPDSKAAGEIAALYKYTCIHLYTEGGEDGQESRRA